MTTATSTRVTVELTPAATPIQGVLRDSEGNRQPFSGWLELSSELEAARACPEGLGQVLFADPNPPAMRTP